MNLSQFLSRIALMIGLGFAPCATAQVEDAALSSALALEAAGKSAAAQQALDRLVSADPLNLFFRLALARSLLRRGEIARARFHLLQARAAPGLSSADRAALVRVLARLEGGRPREGWMRFALVPESNPGQRTAAQTIDFGGFTWQLDEAARAKAGTGINIAFGGALTPEISEGLRLRFGASLDARLYEESALNDLFLRSEVGLQGLTATGLAWRGGLTSTYRQTGGQSHGRALGLQGEVTRSLGRATHLRLKAELESWRHPVFTAQDGRRSAVSLMLVQAWRADLLLRAGLYLSRNAARARWESSRALGLSLGMQRAFQGGLILGLDLSRSRIARDGPAPLFAVTRREQRTSLTARLLHRDVTVKGFAPALELGLDRQTSPVSLYDYRNLRLSIGFTREF